MLRGGSSIASKGAHAKVILLLGSFYNCGFYGARTYNFGGPFYNCGWHTLMILV